MTVNKSGQQEQEQKGERLAKVIARAGYCSRRDAERLIAELKVRVNGKVIDTPATLVTPKDRIDIEGRPLQAAQPTRLWLYHKPAGLVTTHKDPEGRETVFDHLPEAMERVISIGRLDLTSEGLLLLTNDGALSRHLEHPATGWTRAYRARAFGRLTDEAVEALARGLRLDSMTYGPIDVKREPGEKSNQWLTVKLQEGKNREVRNALQAVGLTVNRLIRVSYGPFQLGDLPRGELREVKPKVLADQLGASVIQELGLTLPTKLLATSQPSLAPRQKSKPQNRALKRR